MSTGILSGPGRRLPSALASVVTMLAIGDTLMRHPGSEDDHPRRTAVAAALAFGLSPLVLIWSRTAVSDALLNGTLALSLLCQWWCYVPDPDGGGGWPGFSWPPLYSKGPVAVVLTGMTLVLFAITRRDLAGLWRRLRPLPGLLITAAISLPGTSLSCWWRSAVLGQLFRLPQPSAAHERGQ